MPNVKLSSEARKRIHMMRTGCYLVLYGKNQTHFLQSTLDEVTVVGRDGSIVSPILRLCQKCTHESLIHLCREGAGSRKGAS